MLNDIVNLRYHLIQQVCVLFLAEAILKVILPTLPFDVLVIAQGSAAGGFLAAKTVSDIKEVRYAKTKPIGD